MKKRIAYVSHHLIVGKKYDRYHSSWTSLQSAAKLFEHLRFFSVLIANFYHLMLVLSIIKLGDHDDFTNINFIKLQ